MQNRKLAVTGLQARRGIVKLEKKRLPKEVLLYTLVKSPPRPAPAAFALSCLAARLAVGALYVSGALVAAILLLAALGGAVLLIRRRLEK